MIHRRLLWFGVVGQMLQVFPLFLAAQLVEVAVRLVLGGDWNQCPPHFRFDSFAPDPSGRYQQGNIPPDFFPENWVFAYDPTVSSNRKCRDPYEKGKTFETLIDFFLVSPNVQVLKVKGVQQDYQFSDHQPVRMQVALSKN